MTDDQAILPGAMRSGLDAPALTSAYVATARRNKARNLRLDIVCADEPDADRVADALAGVEGLRVGRVSDAPTNAGDWATTYNSDVLVGSIQSFAVDYLYQTLHAEESGVGQVDRASVLLDGADRLLGDRGHWRAEIRVDDDAVLDRILYVDFASLYGTVSGTCRGAPSEIFVSRCLRLGVHVDPSSSRGSAPSRRNRLNAWGEATREEAAGIEFRQRSSLVEDRTSLVEISGSTSGIQRSVMRAVEAAPLVENRFAERDALFGALGLSPSAHDASTRAGLHHAVSDRVDRVTAGGKDVAAFRAAQLAALRLHAPLWMAHLADMDELARRHSKLNNGADFERYVEEAYLAFNALRADALVTWAAWVIG